MFDIVCDHAPFCISREYVAASEQAGFLVGVNADGNHLHASPETIERLGVHVEWIASDVHSDILPVRLRQVCRDDTCVVFRMSCEALTCSWQAAPVTDDTAPFLSEVRLTAASPEALERAKVNVFVGVSGPAGYRLLPLSVLHDGDPAPPLAYRGPATQEDAADHPRRRPAG